MSQFRHWTIDHLDGFCTLTIDVVGNRQNVLSSEVIKELNEVVNQIADLSTQGLIIQSGKPGSFISGADVSEFREIETPEQALEITQLAHSALNRIESLPFPSVALIDGHCLGGGLELALACDFRICSDKTEIRLGLPEVKMGIHPGFGGSVRLIEILGVFQAMNLILGGRSVTPYTAKKIGLVDLCLPNRQLERGAHFALNGKLRKSSPPKFSRVLTLKPARKLLSVILRKKISSRAHEKHYPAPYRLIDLWEKYGGNRDAMLEGEQKSVAKLITTPTSRNLVKVFFLQELLKQQEKAKMENFTPQVHVIGAGVMGGDIASWCALQGFRVTIHDRSTDALANARERAHQLFRRKLKQSRLIERAMDRYQLDTTGDGAKRADIIIEAIIEKQQAKIALFREIENVARSDAILATNTSSIPLENISAALQSPGRLVGLHFFNPVAKMQLVEIVKGNHTRNSSVSWAKSFTRVIGRLPVEVKSSPGFLVNRILMPYALEAIELLMEGNKPEMIDQIATEFGMPMGPITLADTVGLDICLHVGDNLVSHYGGILPDILNKTVAAGNLGKKTGKGFYHWKNGTPVKGKVDISGVSSDIQDRLIFRYLNECVDCMHQGLVESHGHLDAAMIFGTGFAPFTGGPMNYIRDKGQDMMLDRLGVLREKYGERFSPSNGWSEICSD